jgi:hypothetical protein
MEGSSALWETLRVRVSWRVNWTGMTLASGNGEFHFVNLTDNVYRVRVNSADYEEISLPVLLTAGVTEVTIDLQPRKSQSVTSAAEKWSTVFRPGVSIKNVVRCTRNAEESDE